MAYRAYIDLVNNTSRIHLESCSYYKNRKRVTRPDNVWSASLLSIESAFKAALENVEMAITAKCCLQHLPIRQTR